MKWRRCNMAEGTTEWALLLESRHAMVWVREVESHWEILARFTEGEDWEVMNGVNTLGEAQQVAQTRYRMEN